MGRGIKKNRSIQNISIIISVITILSLVVIAGCSNTLMDDVLEKIIEDNNGVGGIDGPKSPSPSDGLSISDVTPQLNWEDVTGATAYHVQVNEAVDFNGIMSIDYNTLTVSQYDVDVTESLDNGKTYYWRVRVQNADSIWGNWSVPWQFTIDINPDIPANPDPSSGSSFIDTTPLLLWDDISSALTYHIQVNTADDFSGITIVNDDTLVLSQYQIDTDSIFSDNTTYYWRVRINIEDNIHGEWSDTWNFNIDITPPAIVSPSNNIIISDTTPYYDWDNVEGATGYQLQVNTSLLFDGDEKLSKQIEVDSFYQTLNTVEEVLSDNITYYFRIRTKNQDEIYGDWCEPFSFSIDIPVPENLSPPDLSICTVPTPRFSWDEISDSTGYQLQLNSQADFLGAMLTDEIISDYTYFTEDTYLSDNTSYYYRVRSKNIDGVWGDWSLTNKITFHRIIAISAGGHSSYALRSDGTAWSWGQDEDGQLGDDSMLVKKNIPTQISGLSNITSICSGSGDTAFAINGTARIYGWGNNEDGALGDGTIISKYIPVLLPKYNNKQVVGDNGLSVLLDRDGAVWTWGDEFSNNLGDGPTDNSRISPVEIRGESEEIRDCITQVASQGLQVLALRNDRTVWVWGYNRDGQLGLGYDTSSDVYYPTQIPDLTDIIDIAVGTEFSMVLQSDGTVRTFGCNEYGQLGFGEIMDINYSTPTLNPTLSNIIDIDTSGRHGAALKDDGTVYCWGRNDYGQLGQGTLVNNQIPTKVDGLTDIIDIACGSSQTLALQDNGIIWAFGRNLDGELGNGTNVNSAIPVQVEW